MTLALPFHLGRYKLVRVLGQGAMGVVYEAEDTRLGRRVAVKTVQHSHLVDEATAGDYAARFEREARAAASLAHPNVVTLFDFGEHGDVSFIVMEFVRGRELAQALDAGERFALADTVRLMQELLAALDYAHRQGIVHRDVKPANVLIDDAGHVKLADFGVARIASATQERTMPGTLVGTPSYMAPEQILGTAVGSRADLFAAGVILYQLLTGRRPFAAAGAFAVQRQIVQEEPQPPSQAEPAVPPAFDAVVARALAKQPAQRFETAAAFADALARAADAAQPAPDDEATVIRPRPAPDAAPAAPRAARRVALACALLALLTAVAAGAWLAWQRDEPAAPAAPAATAPAEPAETAAAPVVSEPVPAPMPLPDEPPPPAAEPRTLPPAPAVARPTPAPNPAPPPTSGVEARCADLLLRLQLGETLADADNRFFQTRCTR